MKNDAADIQKDLANEKISKLLWRFGLPAIAGLVVNSLYYLVDRIFVGNGVGSVGLGAVAVSYPVFIFMMAVAMMVGVGGSVNFSVRLGQNKIPTAERIMANAFVLIFIAGAVTSLLLRVFLKDILLFFGATQTILPYAETYVRICLLSGTLYMTNMVLNNFIRACGHPRYAMMTLMVGAGANTVLDPIFIFVLNRGIAGAAQATVMSQVLSFLFAAAFFVKRSPFKVRRRNLMLSLNVVLAIVNTGMAQFAIQICAGFVQTILNRSLRAYGGDDALSAMSVSTSTVLFMLMFVIGLCEGAQPIIAFNFGAKKYDRLRRVFMTTASVSTLISLVGQIVIFTQPRAIALLFNPADEEWLKVGLIALPTASAGLCTVGMQIATSLFLQATKRTKTAMCLVLSRQLLFLAPALYILPHYFGLRGVYAAIPVSDTLAFLCALEIFRRQMLHYKKMSAESENSVF